MSKRASTRLLTAGDSVRVANDVRTGTVTNVGRYDVTVRVLNAGKIEHRRFDRGALIWQAPVSEIAVVPVIDEALAV